MEENVDESLTSEVSNLLDQSDDAEEVDAGSWLAHADHTLTGYVVVKMGEKRRRLKIAALTEQETMQLMKASRRFDRTNPNGGKIDFLQYRLRMIAFSINKANGTNEVTPEALQQKLTGELTKIQQAIFKLSGMDEDGAPKETSDSAINDFFA